MNLNILYICTYIHAYTHFRIKPQYIPVSPSWRRHTYTLPLSPKGGY